MKPARFTPLSGQRGVTLIMALIFLAVLMLLGVTVAQNTSMEERMAGNTRDRDLAFQAAEAALKDAEANLAGYLANPFDGSTPGLIAFDAANATDATYWNAYNWAGASQTVSTTLAIVPGYIIAEQPRYVIEKKPNTGPVGSPIQHFRVTARGVGGSASTVVILQAEYEYN
jgi:type IV pilus assembly protein PilX